MSKVRFLIGDIALEAELRDTPTARELLKVLPLESTGSYWGKEFYFDTPVIVPLEPDATDVVESGAVAYWAAGHCLCLLWGPTPASRGDECRLASEANVVGKVLNAEDLPKLKARGVRVEAVESPRR